ncbi:MAG: glycosyltransferase family 8 protein [Verrucomicrobiales bacterium]|nr:glycosyltransferase family 8 protein [Verrucomicrobiales bacterium]
MKETMHIVFSPDENYAAPVGVAVWSILQHAADPGRFHFHFLQGINSLSEGARDKLMLVINQFGAKGDFVIVNSSLVQAYGELGPEYITAAAYYRLLIPDVFRELERCLYLDCDVVALGDIAGLWDMAMSEAGISAIVDCYVDRENLQRYNEVRHYFNSGVLMMNLRRWRERNYIKQCLSLARKPELHERFADQDILNIVFCEDVHILHPRWNIQTGQKPLFKSGDLQPDLQQWREIRQAPKIAHFTSHKKPWNMGMKHDWSMEYWKVLEQTPWGREMRGFGKKMLVAKCFRLKAKLTKLLRWLLTYRKNSACGACRISLCGRLIVDRKPQQP